MGGSDCRCCWNLKRLVRRWLCALCIHRPWAGALCTWSPMNPHVRPRRWVVTGFLNSREDQRRLSNGAESEQWVGERDSDAGLPAPAAGAFCYLETSRALLVLPHDKIKTCQPSSSLSQPLSKDKWTLCSLDSHCAFGNRPPNIGKPDGVGHEDQILCLRNFLFPPTNRPPSSTRAFWLPLKVNK